MTDLCSSKDFRHPVSSLGYVTVLNKSLWIRRFPDERATKENTFVSKSVLSVMGNWLGFVYERSSPL
jgi:hypothetical protein